MLIKAISSPCYSMSISFREIFFKVGIKMDILETQLMRLSDAEPHFNFRDYVKNTPKRIISYLYDRWNFYRLINTACTATVIQDFIEEKPSQVTLTSWAFSIENIV